MPEPLTIVMYHYVRDLPRTRWPRINGLLTERFEGQLDYIARHYTVVGEPQVADAHAGRGALPPRPCWLTFDDGLVDHYETVFPRLADCGWCGSFFPAAGPLATGELLDVHRIHFILASAEDPMPVHDALVGEIGRLANGGALGPGPAGGDAASPTLDRLRARYLRPNRFDPAEVNFIKRVLQRGLPEAARGEICKRLFARFVTGDEAGFAGALYMSLDQMRKMAGAGMTFGGHGWRHRWLDALPPGEQADEIDRSVSLLQRISGRRPARWTMCYPYGSFNAETLSQLRAGGCDLGLTTRVGLATEADEPLALPRLDTNDLPTAPDAPPNDWTRQAR